MRARRVVWLLLPLLAAVPSPLLHAEGETVKRALLIGIDEYAPDQAASAGAVVPDAVSRPTRPKAGRAGWYDLDGAVNDVVAMREILLARYGFGPKDIHVLLNQDASRANMLAAIRAQLVDASKPGDVVFFYYAGHGSQAENSKEVDGLDETLVPADSNTGAFDIRDKYLRRLLNDAIDKGAVVTAVFDSCHSGSIARGMGKPRMLSRDSRDMAAGVDDRELAEDPRAPPGERGALILSAAQSDQVAQEAEDSDGHSRGAFSLALVEAMQTAPIEEPVDRLVLRVDAALRAEGRVQKPVIDATPERRRRSLLGFEATGSGRPTVAVLEVDDDGSVWLGGGLALGLGPQSELVKTGAPGVRLRVESVDGMNRARARRIAGKASGVAIGDPFELDRWVPPVGPQLRVWIPGEPISETDLAAAAAALVELRESDAITWVDDPTDRQPPDAPLHVISWEDGRWRLHAPDGRSEDLGVLPRVSEIASKLAAGAGGEPAPLFVQLPPTREVLDGLQFLGQERAAIEATRDLAHAHYWLVGRIAGGRPEYAWVLPQATREDTRATLALPRRTRWVGAPADPSEPAAWQELERAAERLARLRSWMTLDGPPSLSGEQAFPYRLVLEGPARTVTRSGEEVHRGEVYDFVLRAAGEALEGTAQKRYVYIFLMDASGRSTLLFPGPQAGIGENRIPSGVAPGEWPREIPLGVKIQVEPPFGIDTYVMLTTVEALPDPGVLAWDPVRGRRQTPVASSTPLGALVTATQTGRRGAGVVTSPLTWSIERLSIRSRE